MPLFDIPGFGQLELTRIIMDFNGTLAKDGALLPGVAERLAELSKTFELRVVSADTFGQVKTVLADTPCKVDVIEKGDEAAAKLAIVRALDPEACVCVGNGANDRLMLAEAGLGVAVIGEECAAGSALAAADVVAKDILGALDLFLNPKRLTATLRD